MWTPGPPAAAKALSPQEAPGRSRHPPSGGRPPVEKAGRRKGPQGPGLRGSLQGRGSGSCFKVGSLRCLHPGPRRRRNGALKRPPGTPAALTMSQQEESLRLHGVGAGLPETERRLGTAEAPARRGDTGHPSLYPTRVCFRLPSQPRQTADASTLGPEHPDMSAAMRSHVLTALPQLAEPRRTSPEPSHPTVALQPSDRWGSRHAAGLSAVPGARTLSHFRGDSKLPFRRAEWHQG